MATFIIVPTGGTNSLEFDLPREYENKAFRLPNGEWLVSYNGTSKQLSDELGISENQSSTAIVFNISGYWGRASNNIWEWLKENGEK